ncbi:autotransporter outer membrane beta-barrel domain-containing protein [Yokenella regensburgei]|uniref:autotransporter outer membrane beta-barrel domain-containing protein n=1 Tax=Yokenella regensburgei TaxID=158877 RepID=UPI00289CC556|nr:autotransporter outer membrane beta-barrel domain-containing protein [Yokenella regensburgei]
MAINFKKSIISIMVLSAFSAVNAMAEDTFSDEIFTDTQSLNDDNEEYTFTAGTVIEASGDGIGLKRKNQTLTFNDGSAINVTGNGIAVGGSNAQITVDGVDTKINAEGNGIYLNGANSALTITNGAKISGEVGIDTTSKSIGSTILVSGSGSVVTATAGDGILLGGLNQSVTVSDGATVAVLDGYDGIYALNSNTHITVDSGAQILGGGEGITVTMDNNTVNISDEGTLVAGGNAGITANYYGHDSTINVFNGAHVISQGSGIYISEENVGDVIAIDGDGTLVSGEQYGINLAGSDQTVSIANGAVVSGDTALGVYGSNNHISASGAVISGTTNALDISSRDTASLSFSQSTLTGNIHQASAANQSVSMDSSSWQGAVTYADEETGALNLNLSNGAVWTTTGDSVVNDITMTNGSAIVMEGGNVSVNSLASDTAFDTGPASIYTTWDPSTSAARLLTAGSATGSFSVGVSSATSGAAGDMTGDEVMHVNDASGATFNSLQTDVGVYRYTTAAVANTDGSVSVVLGTITPDPTPAPDPDPDPTPDPTPAPEPDPAPTPDPVPDPDQGDATPDNNATPRPTLSTASQAVVDTRAAAVNLWYDEEDALLLRMDSERRSDSEGVWGSYYGSNHRQSMNQASSSFDQTTQGFMVGADKRIPLASGNLLFGTAVMRGYSNNNMHDAGNSGTNTNSYGGALYGSYRMNNGLFFDATLKAEHLNNSMDVISTDGGHSHGDYSNNGYGGTLKAGWHWQNDTLFVEHYARVSAIHYNGVNYKLDNGLHAKDSRYKSLRVEGGVNMGTTLNVHNTEVRPYLHFAVASETENSNKININDVGINDSNHGRKGIAGVGTEIKLAKSLHVWAGANYAKGDNKEDPWQVSVGASWSW